MYLVKLKRGSYIHQKLTLIGINLTLGCKNSLLVI